MAYEYTVIAAPDRGEKSKTTRTAANRYALALASELNRMAADGWDYVRAETLPSEERSGLTGRATVYHNVLVFRRSKVARQGEAVARQPQPEYPVSASPVRNPEPDPATPAAAAPQKSDHAEPAASAVPAPNGEAAVPPAPRDNDQAPR
ncbi:hypothetical protein SAMN04489859_101529 [Paracoccus alcaliphilus]|uniref:DUF4177 domain-containing protein n=1 Tax=Paracoccus alcaliphilus TaxID=34002 RepID=A0A1H8J1Q3_9RHOB|nr:DUF4177 domain-containing protein [Paracoccus alcaliphilus]WCR16641.1 DUF4177 domain-containing protein [Paracoccus alcaliphilus]SEN74599.1 hypothetical protein SAMN04489859_101529 [Paracoccus alcaliphilus]